MYACGDKNSNPSNNSRRNTMAKKMTRDEFRTTVNSARGEFGKGVSLLNELSTLLARSDEFTFSGLEASKNFLEQVKKLESAAKTVRDAFVQRGKTKTAEECVMFNVTKKCPILQHRKEALSLLSDDVGEVIANADGSLTANGRNGSITLK
jgi:hypothetical protein